MDAKSIAARHSEFAKTTKACFAALQRVTAASKVLSAAMSEANRHLAVVYSGDESPIAAHVHQFLELAEPSQPNAVHAAARLEAEAESAQQCYDEAFKTLKHGRADDQATFYEQRTDGIDRVAAAYIAFARGPALPRAAQATQAAETRAQDLLLAELGVLAVDAGAGDFEIDRDPAAAGDIALLLRNRLASHYLGLYLKESKRDEALRFWREAELLRRENDLVRLRERAHRLYERFIMENAKEQINVSTDTRARIFQGIAREPHADVAPFALAQHEMLQLMLSCEVFGEFKGSTKYQRMLRRLTPKPFSPGNRASGPGASSSFATAESSPIGSSSPVVGSGGSFSAVGKGIARPRSAGVRGSQSQSPSPTHAIPASTPPPLSSSAFGQQQQQGSPSSSVEFDSSSLTLESVIENRESCRVFKQFLLERSGARPLKFWRRIQKLRATMTRIARSEVPEKDSEKASAKFRESANAIFEEFLLAGHRGGPVGVEEETSSNLHSAILDPESTPQAIMRAFHLAEEEVLDSLRRTSFKQFINDPTNVAEVSVLRTRFRVSSKSSAQLVTPPSVRRSSNSRITVQPAQLACSQQQQQQQQQMPPPPPPPLGQPIPSQHTVAIPRSASNPSFVYGSSPLSTSTGAMPPPSLPPPPTRSPGSAAMTGSTSDLNQSCEEVTVGSTAHKTTTASAEAHKSLSELFDAARQRFEKLIAKAQQQQEQDPAVIAEQLVPIAMALAPAIESITPPTQTPPEGPPPSPPSSAEQNLRQSIASIGGQMDTIQRYLQQTVESQKATSSRACALQTAFQCLLMHIAAIESSL